MSIENKIKAIQEAKPSIALVLGSGLGSFVDACEIKEKISFDEIENLPISKVKGHAGCFILAEINKTPLLIAQGRVHLYEGWSSQEVTAHTRFIHSLGVDNLILTNAAGLINLDFKPGQWMQLNDHLNLTGTTPLLGTSHFADMSEVYAQKLQQHFQNIAQEENIPLQKGVYAGLLGPQYETPAEVQMLKTMGADAVGMSTVLEAIQANALGMRVAAFSCLTNYAAGLKQKSLNHEEVLETGKIAAADFVTLLKKALPSLPA